MGSPGALTGAPSVAHPQQSRRGGPVADFAARYYALDAVRPGDPDSYFRVMSGGRYERWDPVTLTWLHVTSAAAREFLSRAIENGDGAFSVDPSEIAEFR